jgi:signal transduction histidine kinase/ligand-binding sensor domain-containing protein
LSRFDGHAFTNYAPGPDLPVSAVRTVTEDRNHDLWVAGFGRIVKMTGGKFVTVDNAPPLESFIVTGLLFDARGNLWIAGNQGIRVLSPDGHVRIYGERDGLPDQFVRAMWADRDGTIWAGTNGGLARLDGDRFVSWISGDAHDRDLVRCLFEDREGDLWVGANNGLIRLRDDIFTVYGKPEGLPSDEPNTVFQDRQGRIWIGFHESGLLLFSKDGKRRYTTREGLPNNEVFSIRESRDGDLLIAARNGMVRMHDGRFTRFVPPDPLSRASVYDTLEDSRDRIWMAAPGGLTELIGKQYRSVIRGEPLLVSAFVTLAEDPAGTLWAGTYGKGLWRIQGDDRRLFTVADGLSSDQIRSLDKDTDGILWIGTFGGGLNAYRDGKFEHFTARDGLLSDNVASVADDGESLWLSTTRGICRIAKSQLRDFAAGRRKVLEPVNYGVEDGLRSAQCSPSYPIGRGGDLMADGRLWFTTSRGIAVIDPKHAGRKPAATPVVQLSEMLADDRPLDLSTAARLPAGTERVQIRYTAIHLSAPEMVRYSYRLEGLDPAWVQAGARRTINYNSLPHRHYRFTVRAELPGGPASETGYAFEVLPHFYETWPFRLLCAAFVMLAAWGVWRLRLRQIRYRFALVLEERARLAREIHDTLAQGFVGISSQLDAVAMSMPEESTPARKYLDIARRMARHSLTEARRSVMDLRASVLEGQDLASALQSGARMWTAGSGVDVDVAVSGPPARLSEEMEQHLLRIAQEAVANVLKHSGASRIAVKLHTEARKLYLRIVDNGHGFDQQGAFSSVGGHFGLIGMRERAERLGGELHLASHPGEGTEVEVTVPLP